MLDLVLKILFICLNIDTVNDFKDHMKEAKNKEGKTIPRRNREDPYLHSWLTDGGEVVSLTLRSTQGHSAAGRIRSIEKSNDLIGNGTRDLPACNIMHQPITLPRAPMKIAVTLNYSGL
jgi:hypothetical protein